MVMEDIQASVHTQGAQRYRKAKDTFLAALDRTTELLSTDTAKSLMDSTAGRSRNVLDGKVGNEDKAGGNGRYKLELRRRETKVLKESKAYERALVQETMGQLNEVKMKEVCFGARKAVAGRYAKIASDLRWVWRIQDADRYRKAAGAVLQAWERSYFSSLADTRRLAERSSR
ncbi:hypothetical protein MMC10_004841 [Thelotrema lepadinum]|nr:hypothetical protein [Thelotrema lepadinum]